MVALNKIQVFWSSRSVYSVYQAFAMSRPCVLAPKLEEIAQDKFICAVFKVHMTQKLSQSKIHQFKRLFKAE